MKLISLLVAVLSVVLLLQLVHTATAAAKGENNNKKKPVAAVDRDEVDDDEEDDDYLPPKKYVKANPLDYTEVVDLMVDVAREECEKLGALVRVPKFDYKNRCEMFAGEVEDLIGISDNMVKETEITQKQMLRNSQASTYMLQLRLNMRTAAKKTLSAVRKREDDVRKDLQRDMMRWVLEVSTRADTRGSASSFNNMGSNGLTPQQLKTISEMMGKKGLGSLDGLNGGKQTKSLFDTSDEDADWAEKISYRLNKAAKRKEKLKKGALYQSLDDPEQDEKPPNYDL